MRLTFSKTEKLKRKELIEKLFTEGKSITKFPLKLIYLKEDHGGEFPVQVAFAVPKKKIKKAVQRNKLKRKLREGFRKHKYNIYNKLEGKYLFMFLYLDENEQNYVLLEDKMKILFNKFLEKVRIEE